MTEAIIVKPSLDRITKKLYRQAKYFEDEVEAVLFESMNRIRNAIIRSMAQEPKTGKLYMKGKNRSIKHIASAKGEPPAVDTGELLRSIMFDVERSGTFGEMEFTGEVGTAGGAPYGKYLEEDLNREWLKPAVNDEVPTLRNNLLSLGVSTLRRIK